MILQVLTDAGQMVHARDAVPGQRLAIAHAGEHQQLWRLKRARRQDDLAACTDLLEFFAPAVFDADRALALEQDAVGMGMSLDAQIRSRRYERMDVAAGRAAALAVLLRHLIDAEPFLLFTVEIVANAELGLACGLQEGLPHRVIGAELIDGKRAALAVIVAV